MGGEREREKVGERKRQGGRGDDLPVFPEVAVKGRQSILLTEAITSYVCCCRFEKKTRGATLIL